VTAPAITAEARQIRFAHALLNAIAWTLIGLGKLTYRMFALSWLAMMWCFVAVRQGWREAKAADDAKGRAARQAAMRR
jgi:hypothetical protein